MFEFDYFFKGPILPVRDHFNTSRNKFKLSNFCFRSQNISLKSEKRTFPSENPLKTALFSTLNNKTFYDFLKIDSDSYLLQIELQPFCSLRAMYSRATDAKTSHRMSISNSLHLKISTHMELEIEERIGETKCIFWDNIHRLKTHSRVNVCNRNLLSSSCQVSSTS